MRSERSLYDGRCCRERRTFASAKTVLTDHNIWDQTPAAVKGYIEANLGKEDNETLPMDSPLLAADKSQYVMIANNDPAMETAGEKAGQLGYAAHLIGWKTGTVADKIKAEVTRRLSLTAIFVGRKETGVLK